MLFCFFFCFCGNYQIIYSDLLYELLRSNRRGYSSVGARRPVEIEVPGSNPAVVFRELRKTRGVVCIRMQLRSCADLKEPE